MQGVTSPTSLKRVGTTSEEAPAVAKPRPAALALLALAGPAATPNTAAGSSTTDAANTLAGLTKEEFMAEMKEDMRKAMSEEIQSGIERAVDRTFHRLTDSIAKVEAKTIQTPRQLHEVRTEVQATN